MTTCLHTNINWQAIGGFSGHKRQLVCANCGSLIQKELSQDELIAQLVKANGLIENLREIIKHRELMFEAQQSSILLRDEEIRRLQTELEETQHPRVTGRFDLDQEVMRLVTAKHSKFALVALVRWLLAKAEIAPAQEDEPVAMPNDEQLEDVLMQLMQKHLSLKGLKHTTYKSWKDGINIERVSTGMMDVAKALLGYYTRPDNSELRKAAEEALPLLDLLVCKYSLDADDYASLQKLRAALEESK